jgi:hypothetical protein
VADDYFAAMQRVEQNLELETRPEKPKHEVVNVQQKEKLLEFAQRLAQRDMAWSERLAIGAQLIMMFDLLGDHPPPPGKHVELMRDNLGGVRDPVEAIPASHGLLLSIHATMRTYIKTASPMPSTMRGNQIYPSVSKRSK